jgi:hypothetical protein
MAIPRSVTRLVWSPAFIGVSESDDDAKRAQKAALTLAASRGEIELKGKRRRRAYLLLGRLES